MPTRDPADEAGDPTVPAGTNALVRGAHERAEQIPRVDDEQYARGAEIARGGMGRIVEARDRRLGRVVALKELLDLDVESMLRFEREALISAQLQHPAIVAVYEAGRWPSGEPFYAMKLVHGRSLDRVIAECGTLAKRLALLPSVLAVFDALAYAHDQRVIHRDLKPANVLVGAFGETVVIDWGLAKRLDEPSSERSDATTPRHGANFATIDGSVMGTPAYMPAEQALGKPLDERADVYALGAILYHVLTGRPPYDGASSHVVLAAVLDGPPTPIRQLVPEVPEDLATIVEKAMARNHAERYATAAELADDLRRFQTGKLVASHTYTLRELVRRWMHRHRASLSVAGVALVVVAVVAVVLLRQVVHEKRAAEDGRVRATSAERIARANLAQALVAKASEAEDAARWDQAAVLYARARVEDEAGHPEAAWRAGRDDARVIPVLDRAHAPDRLAAMTATSDAAVAIVALANGELVERDFGGGAWRTLGKTPAPATAVAVTPDGRLAIVGDRDGRLVTIERATRRIVMTAETGSAVRSIAVAADGATLATGHDDGDIRTWRVGGAEPERVLTGHAQKIYAVRYARDGTLASTSDDRTVRLWRADRSDVLSAHEPGGIKAVAFSPDGATLAAAGWDRRIEIWSTRDAKLVQQWSTDHIVEALAYAPDGTWLASAGAGHEIALWDAGIGTRLARLAGHEYDVLALAVSTDGRRLVSADRDGELRWWDPSAASTTARTVGHQGRIEAMISRGDLLATTGGDATLRTWQMPQGLPRLRVSTPDGAPYRFGATPDGALLVAPGADGIVRAWSADDGHLVHAIDLGESCWSLAVSPDGAWYAVGAASGRVFLIRASDGAIVQRIAAHRHIVHNVEWVGSGTLVTVGLDGWLRWWSVPDAKLLWELRVETDNLAARVSSDGRLAAVAGTDSTIELVDLVERRTRAVLPGHAARIWDIAFSPDVTALASTSDDGSVRVTRIADGAVIAELRGDHAWGAARALAYVAGNKLAVGYGDGTIAVWDPDKRERVIELGHARSVAFGSCAHIQSADRNDAIVRSCTMTADGYLAYISARTALGGSGIEIEPIAPPARDSQLP